MQDLLHRDGAVAMEDLARAGDLVLGAWMHGDRRAAATHPLRELIGLAVVLWALIEQRVEVVGDARDEGIARLGIGLPGLEERGQLHPVSRKAVRHELGAHAVRNAVILEQCHDHWCHMRWKRASPGPGSPLVPR